MKPLTAHPIAPAVLCPIVFLALACATHSSHRSGQPDVNLITLEQITASEAVTAYEAIQRVRPHFLTSRIDLSPQAERRVYLDGARIGGIDQLRAIPAMTVREIRFVRSVEGGGGGTDTSGAAIIVLSKNGRQP